MGKKSSPKISFNVICENGKKVVFTEAQKDYIVDKYINNVDASTVTIGKEFNVSYPLIRRVLKERNVASKSLRSFRKIYDLDIDFFEVIDTEEKAYWLGFLYADGVIIEKENCVRINLAAIDEGHLYKFRDALKSTHPIKKTSKKIEDKIFEGRYFSIKCSKLCKDLIEKGCGSKKSFTLNFPSGNIVPKRLIHHFIRGYFDGDGSISYTTRNGKYSNRRLYKISILGTENFLSTIIKHLNVNVVPKKTKNIYCVYLGGNQQVRNIINHLYKDSTTFLERKKSKTDECLDYIKNNPYTAWNKGMKKEKQ